MASVLATTLPNSAANNASFNILDDRRLGLGSFDDSDGDSSTTTTPDRHPAGVAHIRALQETCANVAQNAKSGTGNPLFSQPAALANTSLTVNLERLRISELQPEGKRPRSEDAGTAEHPVVSRKLPVRPALGSETFYPLSDESPTTPSLGGTISEIAGAEVGASACDSLEPIIEGSPLEGRKTDEVGGIFADHPLMHLPSNFANIEEQADKTQGGQYELHLTYPATLQPDSNLRRDENRHPALSDGTEIVYGSSSLGDESVLPEEPKVLVDQMNPVAVQAGAHLAPTTPLKGQDVSEAASTTPASVATPNGFTKSPTPSSASNLLHIEDSFEALDKLEDELEAVNAVAHFKRVPSPERGPPRIPNSASKSQQLGRAGLARRPRSTLYPATVRAKASEPLQPAVHRSRSMSVDADDRKLSVPANGSSAVGQSETPSRKPAPKPASLAPPKPLAKSAKPRTVPNFELPGEAVARRLKEQREARLSAQVEPQKTPQPGRTSFPQRSKSTRVLPKPTFELPGEAISRRKREEREAKLRAQEEEEKKRREFKARPIRGSLNPPSTLPRDTVTSRARLSKASEDSSGAAGKRASLAPTSSTLSGSPQPRGRTAASSQVSRAASLSATSSVSKRSTGSSGSPSQKITGREIFERDSKRMTVREKERAEREMLAKKAREEAAERSRQAGREWAEKQRRKRASMAGGSSTG